MTGNAVEVCIVNGLGSFMMIFLLLTRVENKEDRNFDDKVFNALVWITLLSCIAEFFTFVVDEKIFPFSTGISYILDSFCFIASCVVGFLWCLYVNYRVYHDRKRIRRSMKFLLIPLFLSVMMGLENLSGSGILFFITSDNTYKRGTMTILIYLFLFLYILYTIFLVEKSRRKGVNVRFFPVYHFVIPCLAGIFVQAMAYGITLGWTGVALGLMFVYVQEQSRNTYMDSLSGLYNRRYMEYVLKKVRLDDKAKLFGIMMDVNNFKQINDVFGHLKGDHAICSIGKILSKTVPSDGIAVRYAGDEFVVLLQTDSETKVNTFIRVLEENIDEFNSKKKEPYTLSLAMGYTQFDDSAGGINQFLSDMDAKMYAAKELHYRQKGADRRRKRD